MKIFPTLKKYKIDVIIVLALFCLAFGVRTMTVDKFPNIYGFDSFWAAKFAKNMVTSGWLWNVPPFDTSKGFNDSTTIYPYGRLSPAPSEVGWWALEAGTYKVAALFNGVSGFDYNLFGGVASWLTAITGALAIPAIYLFGRAAFNRYVGLGSALFLATSGNHLFYSVFGHAENDALGFSLFFLGMFAFIMTIKKRDWRFGVLTTFLFGWLSFTWRSHDVAVLLLSGTIAAYFAIYYVLNQVGYYKNSPERDKERKWMIYALGFILASIIINMPIEWFTSAMVIGTAGIAILFCSMIEVISRKIPVNKESFKKEKILQLSAIALALLAVGMFLPHYGIQMINVPLGYMGIDISGTAFTPPDYTQRMDTTIAEQNPISGANFLDRLNTLAQGGSGIAIWLALAGALFAFAKLSIMPFIRKDFNWQWDLMALAFILFSMYALTSKAVTMFFLSGAIAFGAGYFVGELVHLIDYLGKYYEKYKLQAKVGMFAIILLFFFSYNITSIPSAESFGYDVYPEWVNLFGWVNNNLPNGSVITSWWDYGHWLSYFSGDHIAVTTDNAQYAPSIYTTALAFTHTVPCSMDKTTQQITCDSSPEALDKAETEALSILKPMGTTHVLIDAEIVGGATGGKFSALSTIANNYVGCMQLVGCQDRQGGTYCLFGTNSEGKEVGLPFNQSRWEELKTAPWPGISLAEYGLPSRAFARESSSGTPGVSTKLLYLSALSCGQFQPNANSPVLFAFQNRLFFRDPNLKHMKLVYDDGWNVIYQIDWKGIPDPEDSVLPNWQENVKIFNERYGA